MNDSLASPTATSTLRRFRAWAWNDPDARSITIGVVAVLLFHFLLWLFGPRLLRFDQMAMAPRPHTTAREFNIELAPETFAKQQPPKPKDPFKFVETNPDAPENIPDKTTNFAAQNQQAAQEKPDPKGESDRAATQGKKDFESNQIVSGRLTQPTEPMQAVPPPPPAAVAEAAETPPKREQNPLSGTEKFEGDNKDGIGGNLAKRLENAQAVPERVEGVKDAPLFDGQIANRVAIDPKQPRPRPLLAKTAQVRPAILADNPVGSKNVGLTGIDARWSEYGEYLHRMIDTVQIQWERLILQQSANPAIGSVVSVKFVMNSEGRISQIIAVDTTANETASRACVSAITDRAPYGAWTDDMRAVLGDKQEMTFTFHYQ